MNQNLFKLLMFINNIEIKIDSQVLTPMGCMISPPAYDIFIFSKIYSFIIVQPNVEDLSQRNNNAAHRSIAVTSMLSTISSAQHLGQTLSDPFLFISENFIRFILIIKFIFLNLRTGCISVDNY